MSARDLHRKFRVIPLSYDHLPEATRLLHAVFTDEAEEEITPGDAFAESLKEIRSPDWNYLRIMRYFLLQEISSGKIVGTTGLYSIKKEYRGTVWMGWYSIHPDYRGRGLGEFLLRWTIRKARALGYNKLRLYTSRNPNEAVAQILYDRYQFKITRTEQLRSDKYRVLYREKHLKAR